MTQTDEIEGTVRMLWGFRSTGGPASIRRVLEKSPDEMDALFGREGHGGSGVTWSCSVFAWGRRVIHFEAPSFAALRRDLGRFGLTTTMRPGGVGRPVGHRYARSQNRGLLTRR